MEDMETLDTRPDVEVTNADIEAHLESLAQQLDTMERQLEAVTAFCKKLDGLVGQLANMEVPPMLANMMGLNKGE